MERLQQNPGSPSHIGGVISNLRRSSSVDAEESEGRRFIRDRIFEQLFAQHTPLESLFLIGVALPNLSIREMPLSKWSSVKAYASAPLLDQVLGGFGPRGELEAEAGIEEFAGNYATALEHQLRLSAQEEHAE